MMFFKDLTPIMLLHLLKAILQEITWLIISVEASWIKIGCNETENALRKQLQRAII